MSDQSFADLGVSSAVARALEDRGFAAPFAIQTKVIGDVLDGRDVLAKSPTGSGKTLAFMVPTIDRIAAEAQRPAALVLAPTRELATQIVESTYAIAHARALKICAVYGGVGLEKQAREAAKAHIVVATPGRLEDLLARGAFSLKHVQILVLDEALSAVDAENEAVIQEALDRLMQGRTTLILAHRLSSVIDCDRILVLDGGKVAEQGKHAELMGRGGVYAGLMAEQVQDSSGPRASSSLGLMSAQDARGPQEHLR